MIGDVPTLQHSSSDLCKTMDFVSVEQINEGKPLLLCTVLARLINVFERTSRHVRTLIRSRGSSRTQIAAAMVIPPTYGTLHLTS